MDAQLHQFLNQYFKLLQFHRTQQIFQEELSRKTLSPKRPNQAKEDCGLVNIFKNAPAKSKRQNNLKKQLKDQSVKYKQVLQAGRQIFSVAINLLQMLHSLKQTQMNQTVLQSIENYKIQLGKHHKVIINEGNPEGAQLIADSVIEEHIQKLEKYLAEGNLDKQVEVFLSLRVNALQIAPQLRKTLVKKLIRKDILNIQKGFQFVIGILSNPNKALRHAVTSLVSVIASTIRGVQYLTSGGNMVLINKIIKIIKQQQNGNITQRFALAILQKASVKDSVVPAIIQNEMIQWILTLVKKSFFTDINIFCLDFSTALLANLFHSRTGLKHFLSHPDLIKHYVQTILKYLKEKMPVSVLMHLLICLNYIYKDTFKPMLNQLNFKQRINDFVVGYSQRIVGQSQASQIDKKTVIDLCNHIFHSRGSEVQDDQAKIIQYQNEQNQLIFECFQDQVNS